MKTNESRSSKLSLVALATAMLVACGGGGGGTDAAPVPVAEVPKAPVVLASSIVTSVPDAMYPLGSEEAAAFALLNDQRGRCGFGLLAQNAMIDNAAKAHADYQLVHNIRSHLENLTEFPLGFTGVAPQDRIAFQGYTNWGASNEEFATTWGVTSKIGQGEQDIRGLLNAPYHLAALVGSSREVGVAVRSSLDVGATYETVITQVNLANTATQGPQLQASNDVLTYPCEGVTGVDFELTDEVPNPVVGRDLSTQPIGSSVYIRLRPGNILSVTSASMVNAATGAQVKLRDVVGQSNDPHRRFGSNAAYVAADAPLARATQYRVSLTGTNDGVAFNRSFVFTTR